LCSYPEERTLAERPRASVELKA
ncbi:MAG: hypothetical protein QOE31_1681, partial [Solirubrobacteraceae bacterium]|nr:hypothetical protein [Solirubrobacteraceae bacterium]